MASGFHDFDLQFFTEFSFAGIIYLIRDRSYRFLIGIIFIAAKL